MTELLQEGVSPCMPIVKTRQLFGMLCIDSAMFRRARAVFENARFLERDFVYDFVYQVLNEYWNAHNSLPKLGLLRSLMQADLQEDEGATDDDAEECSEVLEVAKQFAVQRKHSPQDFDVSQKVCGKLLDDFITQLHRESVRYEILHGDLSLVLRKSQQALREALATGTEMFVNPLTDLMINGRDGRFTLTGNRLVDLYTGGTGPVTGDIVGHAAPRGQGKSQMVAMVANEVAQNERVNAKKEGRELRWVYLFNYEQIDDPLTHSLSYMAKIPRNTLEDFIFTGKKSQFSSGQDYKPYELARYASWIRKAREGNAPWPLAELERLERSYKQIIKNLMIVDFTGSSEHLFNLSNAYVDGVVEFIEAHQESIGNPGVEAVLIDYAGTLVRAHLRRGTHKLYGESAERKLLEELPFALKRELANPFRTFVWLAHQLAAAEAGRKGGTRPDPNAFKDSKSFAENCNHVLVSGNTTPEGLAIFVSSKARRGKKQPDQIGRLVGEYCHWEPVDSGFTIVGDQVMSDEDARFISGDDGNGGGFIPPDLDF